MEPHEGQCKRNHVGQSLERLAERGGLGAAEAECVVDGRRWTVNDDLNELRRAWFERAERVNREWLNRWISVEDRLPEAGVDVMLYRPGTDPYPGYLDDVSIFNWASAAEVIGVTHWQPMPGPPIADPRCQECGGKLDDDGTPTKCHLCCEYPSEAGSDDRTNDKQEGNRR